MPRVSVANLAQTVPFTANTTVGSMALVAAPSQSTSSKRRKRHRYRPSSSSSDKVTLHPGSPTSVSELDMVLGVEGTDQEVI